MPYRLYKIWTKTNDGQWVIPLVLSAEETSSILSPYQALATTIPGFLRKNVRPSDRQIVTSFDFETIEGAKELYRRYTENSNVVFAYSGLVANRAAAAGLTYSLAWRLTKVFP